MTILATPPAGKAGGIVAAAKTNCSTYFAYPNPTPRLGQHTKKRLLFLLSEKQQTLCMTKSIHRQLP